MKRLIWLLTLITSHAVNASADMRVAKDTSPTNPSWYVTYETTTGTWVRAWGIIFPTGEGMPPVTIGDRFDRVDERKTYIWTGTQWILGAIWGAVLPPTGDLISITVAPTCPIGYTEVPEFAGKLLLGTVAANMDVGGTGSISFISPPAGPGPPASQLAFVRVIFCKQN